MAFSEVFHFPTTTNPVTQNKALSLIIDGFLFVGGAVVAISLLWSLFFLLNFQIAQPSINNNNIDTINMNKFHDPPDPTFYDDPNLSFSLAHPIKDWDAKRTEWLKHHPSFASNQILLVTGSQSSACKNPIGDHLLLRFFKNKVDYCRIHGYDIFYNNLLLHPKMTGFWAKYPIIRAAMVAHPEADWIWWIDSDAVFTDMELRIPLEKYKDYNFVVHGWSSLLYEKQSWTSINAGVFLIRNCQWSMDFIDAWVRMGPQTPEYDHWCQMQRSTFKDKIYVEEDDQAALIYLLLKENEKWGNKIYIEEDYHLHKYWLQVVEDYDNITKGYMEIQREVPTLRRRHAEKVTESYGESWEKYLKANKSFKRRPLITHFTGCEPCTGNHNPSYSWDSCFNGMQRALNMADNQVLSNYGFVHQSLMDSSTVFPLKI